MDTLATSGGVVHDMCAAVARSVILAGTGVILCTSNCGLLIIQLFFHNLGKTSPRRRPESPHAKSGREASGAGVASDDSLDGFARGASGGADARLASLEYALSTVLQVRMPMMASLRYEDAFYAVCWSCFLTCSL
jgi:hypothetical protein